MGGIDEIKVGDIYQCTWGWEQTNVNYYQVVQKTAKMVRIKPIRSRTTEDGYCCGHSVPCKDEFKTGDYYDPFVKGEKLCKVYDDGWIRLSSDHSACKWDGHPMYVSWYH